MKFTTAIRELAKGKVIGRRFPNNCFNEYLVMIESNEGDFVYRYIPSAKIEPISSNLLLTKECICESVWYVCEDKEVLEFVKELRKK